LELEILTRGIIQIRTANATAMNFLGALPFQIKAINCKKICDSSQNISGYFSSNADADEQDSLIRKDSRIDERKNKNRKEYVRLPIKNTGAKASNSKVITAIGNNNEFPAKEQKSKSK
jgi:hypothetical protein